MVLLSFNDQVVPDSIISLDSDRRVKGNNLSVRHDANFVRKNVSLFDVLCGQDDAPCLLDLLN